MQLSRYPTRGGETSGSAHQANFRFVPGQLRPVTEPMIVAEFDNFGDGLQRSSDFKISISFQDIALMLQILKNHGHPGATKLVGEADLDALKTPWGFEVR